MEQKIQQVQQKVQMQVQRMDQRQQLQVRPVQLALQPPRPKRRLPRPKPRPKRRLNGHGANELGSGWHVASIRSVGASENCDRIFLARKETIMTTTEITRQHQFLKEILQTLQHNVLATFWCCSDWRLAFHFVSLRPGDLMSLLDSWDLNLKGHFNQWNISHLKFNLQNFAGFSGPSCLFGVLWQVIGVWGWEHWKHRTVRWVSIANFVMWDSHCCSDCEDPGDSFAVPRQDLVTRSQQHPGNLPWFCLHLVTLVQVFAVFATGWWLDQTNGMSCCNCHVFPEYYFIVVVWY